MPVLSSVARLRRILFVHGNSHEKLAVLRVSSFIRRTGLAAHCVLGSCLVSMLANVGSIQDAQNAFDQLDCRDESCWNSLIGGYVKSGQLRLGLTLYRRMMQQDSVCPDEYNFVSLLRACAKLKDLETGSMLHDHISRIGLLTTNCFLGSALIHMYAKCGSLERAHLLLDVLPVRDVVTWTALIGGYVQHERCEEALYCFERMKLAGVSPNSYTFTCSLKACGSIGAAYMGKEIHAEIARAGLLEGDLVLGNALIDMYAKCGLFVKARNVFESIVVRDVVTWTALISGYAQHGYGEEALEFFERMRRTGISPNSITLASSLKACGSIGAKDRGREIHGYITRNGLLHKDVILGTALVDMYAKCGILDKAQAVFDELVIRDVVSWNSLITGHSQVGGAEDALHVFERMRREGSKPNSVTFVSVLNACSHAGFIDKGQEYFEIMTKEYRIAPTLEHDTCMVDLFSRAGQIESAIATMKETSSHPNVVLWLTVLGACRRWHNLELGMYAFHETIKLDEKEAGAYICMSNIYVDAGMHEDALKIEAMRVEKEAWKARKVTTMD